MRTILMLWRWLLLMILSLVTYHGTYWPLICHIFLQRNGDILVQVTGRRCSTNLPQGGLEVLCTLTFVGESKDLLKIEKLKNAVPASLTIPVEPPKKWAKIVDLSSDDADLLDETDDDVWLKFDGLCLTHMDKQELLNGKLNDRHIKLCPKVTA